MHIYKATKSLILVDIHLKAIKLNSPILGEKCPKPPKSHPPPPPSALYPTTPLEITHEYVYTPMASSFILSYEHGTCNLSNSNVYNPTNELQIHTQSIGICHANSHISHNTPHTWHHPTRWHPQQYLFTQQSQKTPLIPIEPPRQAIHISRT